MDKNLTYTLEWGKREFPNDSLEASIFSDAILSFNKEFFDFIILTPSTPIEKSVFLQVSSPHQTPKNMMPVEIRFVYDNGEFKHYQYYSNNVTEVTEIFMKYWGECQIPDLSKWVDITEDL